MGVVTGRCLCGFVAYSYSGVVGPAGYCHCRDCRQCSGSAFGISVRFDADKFALSQGRVKGYTKRGASGAALTRHFCPECGSPIYTSSERHADFVYVKAGSLDDSALVRPAHQSWVSSAVPWCTIDASLPVFDRART
jgi:hypothetical protein